MEYFMEIVNAFMPLTISVKHLILDVWRGSAKWQKNPAKKKDEIDDKKRENEEKVKERNNKYKVNLSQNTIVFHLRPWLY